MTGPMGRVNPLRFSTKYQDDETDLVYYGYRYYNPSTGRWPNRDPIGELGGANLYAFVANNPLTAIDPLGLDTSGAADSLNISSDEHNTYLEFHITCPKCKIAKNIKVDYNDAHMWDEMYDDFNNGQRSEPDYIAWMQNGLAIGGSHSKGFGGLDGQPQGNCNGDPVEVDAYMRTRLVSPGLQVSIWRLFYYVDPSTMQSLYRENTRIDYTCEPCSSGK
jgi:RHS repeat-associated protein